MLSDVNEQIERKKCKECAKQSPSRKYNNHVAGCICGSESVVQKVSGEGREVDFVIV